MDDPKGKPRRHKRIAFLLSTMGLLVFWTLTLDSNFVRQDVRIDPARAADLASRCDASWQDVAMQAPSDGVFLKAWLFTPKRANRRAILFVHGRGGSRQHMLASTRYFLDAGYTCLLIDQRGTGGSGGVFSYGVHERFDLASWARWLRNRPQINVVFGYGGSRGSTTLIQSLSANPPLDGLAAVSAGIGIIGHPYEFLANQSGISEQTARLLSWPFIEPSFAWIKLRQGINLRGSVSGLDAIRSTKVPVLIIQGGADQNTPLKGAIKMRDANPDKVELIVIPNADLDWFSNGKPEVIGRVLSWFDQQAAAR